MLEGDGHPWWVETSGEGSRERWESQDWFYNEEDPDDWGSGLGAREERGARGGWGTRGGRRGFYAFSTYNL